MIVDALILDSSLITTRFTARGAASPMLNSSSARRLASKPQRRYQLKQFFAQAPIYGRRAESYAIGSTVVKFTLVQVARVRTASPPVSNMELAATVANPRIGFAGSSVS